MARLTRRRLLQAGTAGVKASVGGMPLATSAQPATPKRGGTVTVALVQAPPSLDAQLTSAQVARDINLHKIESRPRRGLPWEYVFYADFLRGDDEPARNALRHLGEVADLVKVLGVYPAA